MQRSDGSYEVTQESADDAVQPDTVTVHGLLRGGAPRKVTLVEAMNVGRDEVWGGVVPDPGMERLQARYAVVGAHLDGPDVLFESARIRLRHLDVWAQLPGMSTRVVEDGSEAVVTLQRPEEVVTAVAYPAGRLVLDSVLTVRRPTVRGAGLARAAELRWEGAAGSGLSVDELWSRLVDPLRVLVTLAVDSESPAISLDLAETAGGQFVEVLHPGLGEADEAVLPAHEVFLTREHLDVRSLGRWLERAPTLGPIPRLVAGVAVSSGRRAVESELLELAAAAEGLHRRTWPNERIISKELARQARRAAMNAVSKDSRHAVEQSLNNLGQISYRDRLRRLASSGLAAVPDLVGDAEAWSARVVEARNGFAHQLPAGEGDETELRENLVLLRSLRWLLTTLLLLEAGTTSQDLGARLADHEPYRHFHRQALRWLPVAYPSAPQDRPSPP